MKASTNSIVQGTSVRREVRTSLSLADKWRLPLCSPASDQGIRRARNHTGDAAGHGAECLVELWRSDHLHREVDRHQDAGHPFQVRHAAFPAEQLSVRLDVAELRWDPGPDRLFLAIDKDHGGPHPGRDRQGLPEEFL